MSKSYRIRTTPGDDKSLNVMIDQDFDYLEILSLKLLQSEVYTRQCSDYGVIVGRVSVNNGFGVPNAKVSVFIPLENDDELNPVISELYPYKTLSDLNDDGYRYNLLPYTKSHTGHKPTGTFFDRGDVLTNPTLIEVFDKYYKYTATTNESGDYMIFGVPTGSQTVVMDVDLSDIGEFSLSPQDLIRMGIATESQVSGTEFKTSSNLRELPQIININKTIEVEPLWGQPEICNLGITRTDFDLSSEVNIEITPTSIFMGSLISTEDGGVVKRNCKPRNKSGSLCSLVSGPGEILTIRQTIQQDENGRPILETFDLEQGGQVIDENGTWLIDVPMNLDYVTTNEFGEQVISNDPEVGIPTKGKYRFKVKWSQSPSLSTPVRRGYFLVPNIKEYGWTNETTDPSKQPIGSIERTLADKSYAFSLDWDEYVNIQDAIDCKDTFYPMQYNKVYTVSQLLDQYRKGYGPNKFVGIKNILDSECESEVNKFPSNDSVFRLDLIYFLFWILLFLFTPIFFTLIPVIHILYMVLYVLTIILCPILVIVIAVVSVICSLIIKPILGLLSKLPKWLYGEKFRKIKNKLDCPDVGDGVKMCRKLREGIDKLKNIKIPNLSYPECSFCDCGGADDLPVNSELSSELQTVFDDVSGGLNNIETSLSILSPFQIPSQYLNIRDFSPNPSDGNPGVYTEDLVYQTLFAGESIGSKQSGTLVPSTRVPEKIISTTNDELPDDDTDVSETSEEYNYFTSSLTLSERLNLFNNKSKYYNEDITTNPGGGVNRIKVSFKPELNSNVYHYDNVIAIVCNESASEIERGTIVSFQNPELSGDSNLNNDDGILNQYGTYSITGNTINNGENSNPSQITINYANPNNSGDDISVTYNITQNESDALYAKFPIDIEYFQVISNLSYSEYTDLVNPNNISGPDWDNNNSFNYRILNNDMSFYRITDSVVNVGPCQPTLEWSVKSREFNPIEYFSGYENQRVIFMVRGVDPNSSRMNIKYDLNRLFGYDFGQNTDSNIIVEDEFKLNHPIKGNYTNLTHDVPNNITADFYYDSFHFVPSQGNDVFNFKQFNTNLHTYYSNTDINNSSFKPDNENDTPAINSVTSVSNGVRRVKNGWDPDPYSQADGINGSNGLIVEWKDQITVTINSFPCNINLNTRRGILNSGINNRGYFLNEIIDGGSLMYQRINISRDGNQTPNELIRYYYASQYDNSLNLNVILNNIETHKIVMRSDRLPTSTSTQLNLNNSFTLHNNSNFEINTFTDDGNVKRQTLPNTGSNSVTADSDEDFTEIENLNEPMIYQNVLNSFNCGNMAPLGCYYNEDGEIKIREKSNDCWSFGGGKQKMDGGCYILITEPFLSLLKDIEVVLEWKDRVQTIFGACRNVFSHLFTNNWINGTLYAFAFKNDVFYSSPFSSRPNQPTSNICRDVAILHNPTNNFYYRSSPWDDNLNEFIGHDANDGYGGNFRYLKFPTTILDMGPRNDYIQELVMSDDFDGYVVKDLDSTSYGDVSELLNMLIVTRLANRNFLTQIVGNGILKFFSRTKLMVDGDYAQMNSINSEIGVSPFESINYAWTSPDQDPIFYNDGGSENDEDTIFGVFFSSDTRVRDFISPKRTIINSTLTADDECSFSNISVFSQEVPFYQWEIKNSDFIFGNQENKWYTDPISEGYFKSKYQSLDRLNPDSRYFRTNGSSETQFDKGYIYAVKGNTQDDLSADIEYWDYNTEPSNMITVGAPYHFYFGLKKGKSAFDRFRRKWINTEEIIIE